MTTRKQLDIPFLPLRPYQQNLWNAFTRYLDIQTRKRLLKEVSDSRKPADVSKASQLRSELDQLPPACNTFVICWPRRHGKDLMALNMLCASSFAKPGTYLYVLENQRSAFDVMWGNRDEENHNLSKIEWLEQMGMVKEANKTRMLIELVNGSKLQVSGAETYEKYRGASYSGLVVSEAAFSDPHVVDVVDPAIRQNDGWRMFISTPNGSNWFHERLQRGQASSTTYVEHEDVNTCSWLTPERITQIEQEELEAKGNTHGKQNFEREYLCSFETSTQGQVYDSEQLLQLPAEVPYLPDYPVYIAWDLGKQDPMCLLFFQHVQGQVRIFHYLQDTGKHVEHYLQLVDNMQFSRKPVMILPWDARIESVSADMSVEQKLVNQGYHAVVVQGQVQDGINNARTHLGKCKVDKENAAYLLKCLANYQYRWDERKKVLSPTPIHDWSSHAADSFRYAMQHVATLERETLHERHDDLAAYYETDYQFELDL